MNLDEKKIMNDLILIKHLKCIKKHNGFIIINYDFLISIIYDFLISIIIILKIYFDYYYYY